MAAHTAQERARYFVEIRRIVTDEVVKRMGPFTERMAERIDSGASVNLNHEQFYTMTVADEERAAAVRIAERAIKDGDV
jgi:hypothetical protein